jgi:cell division protein FtsQ
MHQLIDKKNKVIIYIIFLILLSTVVNKTHEKQNNYPILINKIDVIGLSADNNLRIVNKLDEFFYKNIFFINKKKINQIISEHTIIDKYYVKKIYPRKLNIKIEQAKFIAKVSGNSQLLVGSNGKIITNEVSNETLPYIFGEFDSKKFLEFKKNIDRSKFNIKDFKSIFFYPSNRWDVLTIDDILIKLPENNFLESLSLAYKILKDDQFINKKIIDLRIKNHLVIE